MKYKYRIIGLILFLGFMVIFNNYTKQEGKRRFQEFNSSIIEGRLVLLQASSKGISFKIANDSIKYRFSPHPWEGKKHFEKIAKKGDSIVKSPFSDTVTLLSNDGIFKFTFIKID